MAIKNGNELEEQLQKLSKVSAEFLDVLGPVEAHFWASKMEQAMAMEGVPRVLAEQLAEAMGKYMSTIAESLGWIKQSADAARDNLSEMRTEAARARRRPSDFVI